MCTRIRQTCTPIMQNIIDKKVMKPLNINSDYLHDTVDHLILSRTNKHTCNTVGPFPNHKQESFDR